MIVLILVICAWLAGPVPVQADTGDHIVQTGDTLFRLALTHGGMVEALRATNGLTGHIIYVGQRLIISTSIAEISVIPTLLTQATAASTHKVVRGENMFSISLKYGLTQATLQTANRLTGNMLYVGQQLIIPSSECPSRLNPSPGRALSPRW